MDTLPILTDHNFEKYVLRKGTIVLVSFVDKTNVYDPEQTKKVLQVATKFEDNDRVLVGEMDVSEGTPLTYGVLNSGSYLFFVNGNIEEGPSINGVEDMPVEDLLEAINELLKKYPN
ncbi:hypothetical protein [Chitinophaga sp. Cy-1792]|uniref:hypothetical protein n=1 Tax=Chitinophaga sp. Cy-1792 TaxID=2608339 RepID=UPI00141DCE06|nr:hypothetical protein [Chitinophaga sp. Cy-1792]NIG56540.1 hypothetical protein [Chitinophaga sp. Cy-1792]